VSIQINRKRENSMIPAVTLMGKAAVGTTVDEVLENAGLNYEIGMEPIYTSSGKVIRDGNYRRTFRKDNDLTLGIVGKSYHVAQNKDLFNIADVLTDQFDVEWDRVGSLDSGRRVFGSFILPDHITIGDNPDETMEQRIYLSNTNDGSGGLRALPTNVRLFCQNQTAHVARMLKEWGINPKALSIRHSSKMEERIGQLKEILKITNHLNIKFAENAAELMRVEMTESDMTEFFIDTFGWTQKTNEKTGEIITDNHPYGLATRGQNQLEVLDELLTHDTNTTGGMAGTAWAAYNAVTEYIDHNGILLASGKPKESSVMNTVFGVGATRKAKAWSNLMELVV